MRVEMPSLKMLNAMAIVLQCLAYNVVSQDFFKAAYFDV